MKEMFSRGNSRSTNGIGYVPGYIPSDIPVTIIGSLNDSFHLRFDPFVDLDHGFRIMDQLQFFMLFVDEPTWHREGFNRPGQAPEHTGEEKTDGLPGPGHRYAPPAVQIVQGMPDGDGITPDVSHVADQGADDFIEDERPFALRP